MTLVASMIASLLLPLSVSAHLMYVALTAEGEIRTLRWFRSSVWFRFICLLSVPLWWSSFDASYISRAQPNPLMHAAFLATPLSMAVLFARIVVFWSDTKVFGRSRTATDILKLAFWRTISSTAALLLYAAGVDALRDRSAFGIFLMFSAAILALVATALFRRAEGIRFRSVKSGELYKRAHVLARRIGVGLQRVSVVPFGRGRLTNGYGGMNQVALTDDYGHWLHGPELDFVIAHELAHIKHKHGIKKLLATIGLYTFCGAIASWTQPAGFAIVSLNFISILTPVMVCDALSRHFEYGADGAAVELTGEPEAGVRSLTNMYRHTEVPTQSGRFQELLSTHPLLVHRLEAIRAAQTHLQRRVSP